MGQDTLAGGPASLMAWGRWLALTGPVSPLVWQAEWTPGSLDPLNTQALDSEQGGAWEGLGQVVGRQASG